jgi:hypothetical protein
MSGLQGQVQCLSMIEGITSINTKEYLVFIISLEEKTLKGKIFNNSLLYTQTYINF